MPDIDLTSPSPAPEVERIPTSVCVSSAEANRLVAEEIAELIRTRAAEGRTAVLGLATGSTPVGVYDELIRMHRNDGLSFQNVVTFNLDEYWPMGPDELQSYHRFMREHLFDHVDIPDGSWHVPSGTVEQEGVAEHCADYERRIEAAGGIDLQLLGIGRTGHVGFNEPGSPKDSKTRMIALDSVTRMDAASDFFGEWNVPRRAITMGVGSILAAKRVILIAFGEHKAPVIRRAVEGEISTSVAASFLQEHPNARIVLDPAASAKLTRIETPWLLGNISRFELEWDEKTVRRAVIWLATTLSKPILKLTDEDYNEHGLQELVSSRGTAYELNIAVFKQLNRTITGWPGGKPGRPSFVPGRGVQSEHPQDEFPKRIVVFSPHPDDDVISMGGTLIRLCDQEHEVHVAYQTSGNIAVFDDEAMKFVDFIDEFTSALGFAEDKGNELAREIQNFIKTKEPAQVDSPELQTTKGLIRRCEARAAAKYSGVKNEHIHFLDLPFYETGKVRKKPLGEEDVQIVMDLLQEVKPHQVYAAGDLSDPHGTHRVCLAAITTALQRLRGTPWMNHCTVWLYRGAWQEWGAHEVEMAVPLAPSEVDRKRMAIFKHQSQKDRALFPGPNDPREFWERAEDRNRVTAEVYDALGLPEYQAIEGFVSWVPSEADQSLVEQKPAAIVEPVP